MKRMCAQTRPLFVLSSERVFGGMEFEPMLTPREKSPLPENVPRGGSNPRRCGQRAQALPTELFWPHMNSPRTVRSGGSWLQNLHWCPNGQPDYGIDEMRETLYIMIKIQTLHNTLPPCNASNNATWNKSVSSLIV